jgi:pimeloyl-ACP methyl ester carboxylesterase
MARRPLAAAPRRFSLVALSMGGYVAFEIFRQAPERVTNLVLLSTSAGADDAQHRGVLVSEKRISVVPDRIEAAGAALRFRPSYSPDFNSTESE